MSVIVNTSSVPCSLSIQNNTADAIQLPLYPDNSTFTIPTGDSVVIKVSTAREYLYYYTTCSDLGLALSEVVAGDSHG